MKIQRRQYASLYGPTTGDRVRLADTELLIEVEKDFTVYGDEAVFGGGKVIRDGMGQSPVATSANGALDTVIDGVTGILFHEQTTASINFAIERLESRPLDAKTIKRHAESFNAERFKRALQ